MKMHSSLIFLTAFFFTVSSISPSVPDFDVHCGDVAVTSQQLAYATYEGCRHQDRIYRSHLHRVKPIKILLSAKRYKGPVFSATSPLFQWKIPDLNLGNKRKVILIFEWRFKSVCLPHGAIYYSTPKKRHFCDNVPVQMTVNYNHRLSEASSRAYSPPGSPMSSEIYLSPESQHYSGSPMSSEIYLSPESQHYSGSDRFPESPRPNEPAKSDNSNVIYRSPWKRVMTSKASGKWLARFKPWNQILNS